MKRTPAEMNRSHHEKNELQNLRHKKYSDAFKGATKEYDQILKGPTKLKWSFGARHVAARWNRDVLNSPEDPQLLESSIHKAIRTGQVGMSTVKRGSEHKVPTELTKGLSIQVPMMQVAGEGEATANKILTLTRAITSGTEWEHRINPEYTWRAVRLRHPEVVMPAKAKDNEDHRVEWLTFRNINDWTDAAKKLLIDMGMVKDAPGSISE